MNTRILRVSFHLLHNKHIRTDITQTINKKIFSLFVLIANICWNKTTGTLFRVERPIMIDIWEFGRTMNYWYNSFVYPIKDVLLIDLKLPFVLQKKRIVPGRNIISLLLCRRKIAAILWTMRNMQTHLVYRVQSFYVLKSRWRIWNHWDLKGCWKGFFCFYGPVSSDGRTPYFIVVKHTNFRNLQLC
jgi:hypothetical protein